MGSLIADRRKLTIKAVFCATVLAATSFTLAQANATVTTPYTTVQPATFTGYAFDACTAPSSASMKAWRDSSPFRAIGVYIGGVNRGCAQPNLTASWVREQVTAGWKLIPLYVGPQATCTTASKKSTLIDNAHADTLGRTTAADAVAKASALGLARQSVLIYDMEAYSTTDDACKRGVLAFMNGWTARLHDLGYLSGFYSSVSSGVAHQVAAYKTAGYTPPDYVDFARWDQVVTVTDAAIPATVWPAGRRMKQYRGGHQETWGGVTINIDSNYVNFVLLSSAKLADFDHNGWSDVLARNSANGNLYLYPGNGSIVSTGARRTLSGGWNAMNAIVRIGDLNRDGREDVVARQPNGALWLYPGTGTGFGTRKKLPGNWSGMREITAIGDLNRDGYPDLLAVQNSNNALYFYPGKAGATLGARKWISDGWDTRDELTGIGDFTGDGQPDLLARVKATGVINVYRGRPGGFLDRIQVATGWQDMRDIIGVGDFNRDGFVDVAAIRKSDNALLLYTSDGQSLTTPVLLTTLSGYTPLL